MRDIYKGMTEKECELMEQNLRSFFSGFGRTVLTYDELAKIMDVLSVYADFNPSQPFQHCKECYFKAGCADRKACRSPKTDKP